MSREWDEGWRAVLCGGGLCDADQNWRGPFLGCRGARRARIVGRTLTGRGVCFGACAGGCATTLSTVALDCVRARACTNKAWQTVQCRASGASGGAHKRQTSGGRWRRCRRRWRRSRRCRGLKSARARRLWIVGSVGGQADVQRVHGRVLVSEMRSLLS